MKKILKKGFLAIAITLLFCSAHLAVIAQQNTVIVTDSKGTGIKGVMVTIFEGTKGKCGCKETFCVIAPFTSGLTNRNGHAEFRNAAKRFKPLTIYTAFIGAKCVPLQQKCTKPEDCIFESTNSQQFTTDDEGKFQEVKIIK